MVEVKDLGRHAGAEVTVAGWVDQLRVHGKVAFLVVRDGTGYVQGVLVKKELSEEVWDCGNGTDPGGLGGGHRGSFGRMHVPPGDSRWG